MASTDVQSTLVGAKAGTGAVVDLLDARRNVTAVLSVSGTVTGGLVAVEASQDGVNWVVRHLFALGDGSAQGYDSTSGAYRYWRAGVSRGVTGGGSVTVTFMESDR